MNTSNIRLIREFKGVTLSVWLALNIAADPPVDLVWLTKTTGYSERTVLKGVAYLCEHGFAIRQNNRWTLSPSPPQDYQIKRAFQGSHVNKTSPA